MNGFFFALMLIAMVLTLASLGMGLVSLARGGEFGRKYSNRIMRLRVLFQGLALVLFAIAILTAS